MEERFDVIVAGGGPAGLTAALYLARAKRRVLVLERERFGGRIAITEEVANYPGIPSVTGEALTDAMREQALCFGAVLRLGTVTGFDMAGADKHIFTERGAFSCRGVILATGTHPREAGFAGEREFLGRGVSCCATCDGRFFTGREVFVVGGGFAAAEEGVFLTQFARHVTILIRGDDFSCAAAVADKARHHPKITVLTHTVVEEVFGAERAEGIRLRNVSTGEVSQVSCPPGDFLGVFVFAGYAPATELLRGMVELDGQGYLPTDDTCRTSLPGVYAAGDVRAKTLRQVVTAVGDGAVAATALDRELARDWE